WMGDQTISLQDFSDFFLSLRLRQASHVHAHRNERKADRTGLAYAYITAQFGNFKNLYLQQVTGPDNIVMKLDPHGRGKLLDTIVRLLKRTYDHLRTAERCQS